VLWLVVGGLLGYVYSIILKDNSMTLNDIVVSMWLGPQNLVAIYKHFAETVIFKSKAGKGK
jgi:hypothetical protein